MRLWFELRSRTDVKIKYSIKGLAIVIIMMIVKLSEMKDRLYRCFVSITLDVMMVGFGLGETRPKRVEV